MRIIYNGVIEGTYIGTDGVFRYRIKEKEDGRIIIDYKFYHIAMGIAIPKNYSKIEDAKKLQTQLKELGVEKEIKIPEPDWDPDSLVDSYEELKSLLYEWAREEDAPRPKKYRFLLKGIEYFLSQGASGSMDLYHYFQFPSTRSFQLPEEVLILLPKKEEYISNFEKEVEKNKEKYKEEKINYLLKEAEKCGLL